MNPKLAPTQLHAPLAALQDKVASLTRPYTTPDKRLIVPQATLSVVFTSADAIFVRARVNKPTLDEHVVFECRGAEYAVLKQAVEDSGLSWEAFFETVCGG